MTAKLKVEFDCSIKDYSVMNYFKTNLGKPKLKLFSSNISFQVFLMMLRIQLVMLYPYNYFINSIFHN